MKYMHNLLNTAALALLAASPALAQDTPDVQGYWAGGYTDGQGGEIQFELTIIDGIGELTYDTSNWGALGFAICEYVFPLENGQPGAVKRNSGAGTGDCLETPAFTIARPAPDTLAVTFANPEFALDAVELGGILRPFSAAEAHAPIAGLDILGVAPGMTVDQIEAVLSDKDYARITERDQKLEYDGYVIEQAAWGRGEDEYGDPIDWIFASFTARKSWLPDEEPVATYVGREWSVPETEAISGSTMVESLATKYGPRSNTINEDRLYDRAGAVLTDSYSCPEGVHQPITSNYLLDSESGNEEVQVTCGAVLSGYVGTDSDTGRASVLKLRLTDPDPLWDDFWKTWSHGEAARLTSIFEGVTNATGAAPEL